MMVLLTNIVEVTNYLVDQSRFSAQSHCPSQVSSSPPLQAMPQLALPGARFLCKRSIQEWPAIDLLQEAALARLCGGRALCYFC